MNAPLDPVAIVGTGVIGRGWVEVFARAGHPTRIWDASPAQAERALAELGPAARAHTTVHHSLAEALDGVAYVQESGPERLEDKQKLFAELDAVAPAEAIIASSTSSYDMTAIAQAVVRPQRCVVAHPMNPPSLIRVVEVLGGAATDPEVVERTCALMEAVGQHPVRMRRYVPGFLLNRLQAALLAEAIHLVTTGVADVEAVDAVVSEGLGPRWAFMGPFATGHSNADDGLGGYLRRYGHVYEALSKDLGPPLVLDERTVDELAQATGRAVGQSVEELRAYRDAMLAAVLTLKAQSVEAALEAGR